jgi:phosphatidylserine decarboxylase
VLNKRFINNLYRLYQESALSKHKIAPFVKKYGINLDDFEQPANGYQSFNDFFIRKLKPGRRAIDAHPHIIIAPADSKLLAIPTLTSSATFWVKSCQFNLETFLHNHQLAADYTNGTMLIFRLAPTDYHHFHFPADGIPDAPMVIAGRFDSVNPIVYKAGYQPLLSNERHIITLHTKTFDTILMIPIGAMLVGKIVETYTPHQPICKGDEAGYFSFGGSTVVLLFKPGIIKLKSHFIENSVNGFETVVKMGEAVTE